MGYLFLLSLEINLVSYIPPNSHLARYLYHIKMHPFKSTNCKNAKKKQNKNLGSVINVIDKNN